MPPAKQLRLNSLLPRSFVSKASCQAASSQKASCQAASSQQPLAMQLRLNSLLPCSFVSTASCQAVSSQQPPAMQFHLNSLLPSSFVSTASCHAASSQQPIKQSRYCCSTFLLSPTMSILSQLVLTLQTLLKAFLLPHACLATLFTAQSLQSFKLVVLFLALYIGKLQG